jgi:hypothetical protein
VIPAVWRVHAVRTEGWVYADFVAADLGGLVRIVKCRLKQIQFRPDLIDGCLAETGLVIEPP